MADSAQDKNLPASARKLAKAREQGQVARSVDLGHFAAIAIGGWLLVKWAPDIGQWMQKILMQGLRFDHAMLQNPRLMGERAAALGMQMLMVIVPMGLVMSLVGVASACLSGGWNFTTQALSPKFDKLNPLTGVTRLFSKGNLVQALKSVMLAAVLGTVGALYLQSRIEAFAATLAMPLPAALQQAVSASLSGLIQVVVTLALFAAIDVPYQRWKLANELKMSFQDVKDEHKEAEGNQEVKQKIKVKMREMARKRMLAAVPNADLVVMNPTHYAVALQYDDKKMGAPRVVAKGADLLALRIRDIARESKVPVLQAPPLARALYQHAELEREIPAALFSAVAQVLAYVYQLRAAMAGEAPEPGDLPELPVPPELDPQNPAYQSGPRRR
ncbi:flagellar biosynthesis protein FlhB [uncultured Aquincola sp.]|uniref:flagellar biosynthesis protein FlhB n=1 Tax=uncultured Aquincola sp. TaxID=886556 RepID=UPI0032B17F75